MAWGVEYRGEFLDLTHSGSTEGLLWTIDIEGKDYTGNISEMVMGGNPLVFEYLSNGDDIVINPIKGSKATINIWSDTHFQYTSLYSAENFKRRVSIYYGDTPTLYWRGWLTAEYSEPYDDTPYEVSVMANDGLGLLKDIDYTPGTTGRVYESQIIFDILGEMGITSFKEFVNVYEDNIDDDVSDSPFDQIRIDTDVFAGANCYDVLNEILKKYNAVIRTVKGEYIIYRPTELTQTTVYGRYFTAYDTKTSISITTQQILNRAGYSSTISDYNGGVLTFTPPICKITATQNYNQVDSWVRNSGLDVDTYDDDTGAFDEWTIVSASGQFSKVNTVFGWETETAGVGMGCPGLIYGTLIPLHTDYIEQDFAPYAEATGDVIEFSFSYRFSNISDADIPTKIHLLITDDTESIYLSRKSSSETELQENSSITYFTTEDMVAEPGLGTWNTWRRVKIGMTKPGPYKIRFFGSTDVDLRLGIKDIVFRATSDAIVNKYHTVTGKILWWKTTSYAWSYDVEDAEEKVVNEYVKENNIAGESFDISYELGDVVDSDIDDVMDQFAGSLSISVMDTAARAAARFAGENYDNYSTGGVIVSSEDNKIRFTSDTPGVSFTGSTTIVPLAGLTGSVSIVQHNSTGTKFKKSITFSGTSGAGLITILAPGLSGTITFSSTLSESVSNFYDDYYSTWDDAGYTLSISSNVLYVEAQTAPDLDLNYKQTSSNLTGVVATVNDYVAPVARIDEVTLDDVFGSATITCDGVSEICTRYSTLIEDYTKSWHTRDNSEENPIIQLVADEIADLYGRERHFIQMRLREQSVTAPEFSVLYNLQDSINKYNGYIRIFAFNRGFFSVKSREWTIDMMEIGTGDTASYTADSTTTTVDNTIITVDNG